MANPWDNDPIVGTLEGEIPPEYAPLRQFGMEMATEAVQAAVQPASRPWESDPIVTSPTKPPPVDDDDWTRFGGNVAQAFKSSPLGRAVTAPSKPVYERDTVKREAAQKQYETEVKQFNLETEADRQTYEKISNWYDSPEDKGAIMGFLDHLKRLGISASGQVLGSMTDPANLVPLGKGANVMGTFLKGATPNSLYNAMVEHSNQLADMELGNRDSIDLEAVAAAGAAGAGVGGGMNVGAHHGKIFKGKSTPTPDPDISGIKERVDAKSVIDPSTAKNPFFVDARKKLKMGDTDIINAVEAAGEAGHSQMDMVQQREIPPWWPDQDLQKAIGKADKAADQAGTFELEYDGPGKGQDVDATDIQSPFMNKAEVKTAQDTGGAAWELDPVVDAVSPVNAPKLGETAGRDAFELAITEQAEANITSRGVTDISQMFTSKLEEEFSKLPYNPEKPRNLDQWIADLKKLGAKSEELYSSAVLPTLEALKRSFPKQTFSHKEIATLIQENKPQIFVKKLSIDGPDKRIDETEYTGYSDYRLNQNHIEYDYLEFLYMAPTLHSSTKADHFKNTVEGDYAFHTRATIITDNQNRKLLNIEELQSDQHQKSGREYGYTPFGQGRDGSVMIKIKQLEDKASKIKKGLRAIRKRKAFLRGRLRDFLDLREGLWQRGWTSDEMQGLTKVKQNLRMEQDRIRNEKLRFEYDFEDINNEVSHRQLQLYRPSVYGLSKREAPEWPDYYYDWVGYKEERKELWDYFVGHYGITEAKKRISRIKQLSQDFHKAAEDFEHRINEQEKAIEKIERAQARFLKLHAPSVTDFAERPVIKQVGSYWIRAYQDAVMINQRLADLNAMNNLLDEVYWDTQYELEALKGDGDNTPITHPFRDSWWKLGIRHLVEYAKANGLDGITLTTPEIQIPRNRLDEGNRKIESHKNWYKRYSEEVSRILGIQPENTNVTARVRGNLNHMEMPLWSFSKGQEALAFLDGEKTYLYTKTNDPLTSIVNDKVYLNKLAKSESAADALKAVAEHTKDPSFRNLAKFVQDAVTEVGFKLRDSLDVPGRYEVSSVSGETAVYVRDIAESILKRKGFGVNERTIVHEGIHAMTEVGLYIGGDPYFRTLPKYRAFRDFYDRAQEATKLGSEFIKNDPEFKNLPKDQQTIIEYAFSNSSEFLAHVSDPIVARYMEKIPYEESRNLLQKVVDWLASLLRPLLKNVTDKEFNLFQRGLHLLHEGKEVKGLWDIDQDKQNLAAAVLRDIYKEGNLNAEHAFHDAIDQSKTPDIDPNWTANEAVFYNDGKELHAAVPQNFTTPVQIEAMSKNVMFGWFKAKLGQINRDAAPRYYDYAQKLKPYMFDRKTKLPRPQIVKSFKAMVDIQDPDLKAARQAAEDNNAREAFLAERGLQGREIDFAIAVLDVMKDVHMRDIASLKRLGREMGYQPMYFPRIHGGKFMVKVLDKNGVEQYVKGFDKYKEALADESRLRNNLIDRDDLVVHRVERAERNNFGDDFSMLLLQEEIDLEFLNKGLRHIEKTRESAPFAFEKRRRDEKVGGYVGENLNSKAEEERLLQAMSWRLLASRNLEVKSRLLSEVKFPLFDNPAALGETPHLRHVIGTFINRELGVDIAHNKGVDKVIQSAVETVAKGYQAIRHFEDRYITGKTKNNFRWDDPMIAHDAARNMVRWWTYMTSVVKLGLNVPVLATNMAQNTLIGLDGVRTAKLEDVDSMHAMTALQRTMLYFGQEGDVRDFMLQAKREGMFEPHSHEHYTTAELPDRTKADKFIQYPRDKVEQATNYITILYYYNFFKHARPDLKGDALKHKVYSYARSFTGEYEQWAQPLMFDKAGTPGQLLTNFSKWHFNQLGRLMTDVRALKAERTAVPILMTAAMAVMSAGLYGLPIVVEYEALRRLGSELGAWDWPPISALGGKIKDSIPAWQLLERGAFTAASDALAQVLGATSGPDMSASMRYSAFFDTPTVAIQHFWDVTTKLLPWMYREGMADIYGVGGNSPRQTEEMIRGVPPVLKEVVKRSYNNTALFKEKVVVNGKTMWRIKDPSDMDQQLYSLDQIENAYHWAGMRSKREINTLESIYYDKYRQRQDKEDIQEYRQGILGNLHNKELFKNNMREIVKLGGMEAGKETIEQMKRNLTAGQIDYFTRELMKIAKERDGVAKKRSLERFKESRSLIE